WQLLSGGFASLARDQNDNAQGGHSSYSATLVPEHSFLWGLGCRLPRKWRGPAPCCSSCWSPAAAADRRNHSPALSRCFSRRREMPIREATRANLRLAFHL